MGLFDFLGKKKKEGEPEIPMPGKGKGTPPDLKSLGPDLKLDVPKFPTLERIPGAMERKADVLGVKKAVEQPPRPEFPSSPQPAPPLKARPSPQPPSQQIPQFSQSPTPPQPPPPRTQPPPEFPTSPQQPLSPQPISVPRVEFTFDRPTATWPSRKTKKVPPEQKPETDEEAPGTEMTREEEEIETEEEEEKEIKREKMEKMEELEPLTKTEKPKVEIKEEKTEEELKHDYLKSGKPIYINFSQYTDVLEGLKSIKQTIQDVDITIQKTASLRAIDTKSRKWRDMADDIQRKLREIDTKLFER